MENVELKYMNLIIDNRKVEVEITQFPTVVGAYDPIQDVIFINRKLMEQPDLCEYVYEHEKEHARYPKGIFIHTWIDIKCWITRPWKFRKAIGKLVRMEKYWRTLIANILLMGFFGLITIVPLLIIIKICEMLF